MKRSLVWQCFEDGYNGEAKCQICGRQVPNKGKNTSNLRSHILHKHREQYDMIYGADNKNKPIKKVRLKETTVASRTPRRHALPDSMVKESHKITSSRCYEVLAAEVLKDFECDEDAGEEQVQDPEIEDVWNYFEKIPPNKAQCILCKETFQRYVPFLTKHMKEKHRKVAWDHSSDSDEDQNVYTEVVYLEEEEQPPSVVTKSKHTKQAPVTKKRRLSSRYEFVNKPKEAGNTPKTDEIDEEIENFGRYVIGLLKKMPKDVSTQLQMDIISMIMKAKLKLETTTNETVSASVSNVTDGVIVTPSNVIVTTPSNVIHTTQNNESLPTLVIGVENES
ncbi:uncharacterized protein LOC123878317 isoform X4 [Maniola jurtina]|uniref:uncharacterized protein LOC123878317 isoform X4 n=1 Tax=Maniola jurtina TaxID=191418 RepID=UPI001E68E1D8|nr:uncharacterized protein LOC123878317 isoform X4 [Maniola jurtina]